MAETTVHRHHAVQVVLSRSGDPVGVEVDSLTVHGVTVVPGDRPHRILGNADWAVIVWVDADTASGRALAAIDAGAAERLARFVDTAPPGTWAEANATIDAIAVVGGTDASTSMVRHGAVMEAMALVPDLVLGGPVPLRVVAARVGLSEGRFGRVFAAETGMSWRRYVRWVRLQASARAVAGGASLTDAAHRAGFADSAHLSRTFRAMFGVTPSLLLHLRWLSSP